LIAVYPNPLTDQTCITFSEEQKDITIIISNNLGQPLKTINFSGKKLIFDASDINEGIYFIQVITDKNEVIHQKIIKG
jgi:hypothetical protein